jgi:hypothetical protein
MEDLQEKLFSAKKGGGAPNEEMLEAYANMLDELEKSDPEKYAELIAELQKQAGQQPGQ